MHHHGIGRWWNWRTSSAQRGRSTYGPTPGSSCPRTGERSPTSPRVALLPLVARSSAATTAARSSTATTPVATATAPSAKMLVPRRGSPDSGSGSSPGIIISSPSPSRSNSDRSPDRSSAGPTLRSSARPLPSVLTLAKDRSRVGGTPGILAVLPTWSRTLEHHPHVHLLVPAGGLSADGTAWITPAHPRFLMPGDMLSTIFRATMRQARAGFLHQIDPAGWERQWTVHVQQIGSGEHAARALSRDISRVALSNHRIARFNHGGVTFRYPHARSGETTRLTLPVNVFISRFLQHVLPRGFTKVRSSGLMSPARRPGLERARSLLPRHRTDGCALPDVSALAGHDPGIRGEAPPASGRRLSRLPTRSPAVRRALPTIESATCRMTGLPCALALAAPLRHSLRCATGLRLTGRTRRTACERTQDPVRNCGLGPRSKDANCRPDRVGRAGHSFQPTVRP